MDRRPARIPSIRRDGVQGGGTRRKRYQVTGETLFGPAEAIRRSRAGREAYKGKTRKRGPKARQGVGGGHSTEEGRDNRLEGRAATSTARTKRGKTAGLPPRGSAPSRQKATSRQKPAQRLNKVRKLQRTLYRVAKSQPERRMTLLYDKVCRLDVLREAWQRVKSNKGAAGVDKIDIEAILEYGEERFLLELQAALQQETYRADCVRRVYIPKPGQPGRQRPLGIPTMKDRVVQMAVKLVIEPLFEADFLPCSYGFRPEKTPRMALGAIVKAFNDGYTHVVDVDLRAYFDTIDHRRLMELVERRVADRKILGLIRAWLRAGILEEGKVRQPERGTPQGGVISPVLANIFLHEVDRCWSTDQGPSGAVLLVRYADDMVLLAKTEAEAKQTWTELQAQLASLNLEVNQEKSRLTTFTQGFCFLGFDFRQVVFRQARRYLYLWPCAKAQSNLSRRIREKVRSFPSSENLLEVILALNRVLVGWCTYFRVGNSNRAFHKADRMARQQLQLWLRRKHQCTWSKAMKRWDYRRLHHQYRLYRMVGKVSHLEGLRRTRPKEGGRRAGCVMWRSRLCGEARRTP